MYKIRFHLGAGEHFMHWQIRNGNDNSPSYHDPDRYSIIMINCKLINVRRIADKINQGSHKEVCAWVRAENAYALISPSEFENQKEVFQCLSYNPKKVPYWTNEDGAFLDGKEYSVIMSYGKKLYVL